MSNAEPYSARALPRCSSSTIVRPTCQYVGIGYGQAVGAQDRFSFLADLGVLYVGAPTSKINAECSSAVTSAECDQLMSDIRAEAAAREHDWRHMQWWPVLSVGFAMRW